MFLGMMHGYKERVTGMLLSAKEAIVTQAEEISDAGKLFELRRFFVILYMVANVWKLQKEDRRSDGGVNFNLIYQQT